MMRTIVFLMMLTSVLPSDGSAQASPSPGLRIRIKQVDGTVLTGTLSTRSAETIQLSVGSSRVEGTIAIPRSEIATLERQQGTRGRGGRWQHYRTPGRWRYRGGHFEGVAGRLRTWRTWRLSLRRGRRRATPGRCRSRRNRACPCGASVRVSVVTNSLGVTHRLALPAAVIG